MCRCCRWGGLGLFVVVLAAGSLLIAQGCEVESASTESTASNTSPGPAAALSWQTSYEAAVEESRSSGRPILADFTGKSWCPPCKQLKQMVFDTDRFADWAGDHVVLLEIDIPQPPAELSPETDELVQRYSIQTVPTVHFLDADGKVIGTIEGGSDDVEAWIGRAEEIISAG